VRSINKTTVLSFGKYKGQAVEQVMKVDADYILWCDAHKIIHINNKLLEECRKLADAQHEDWLRDYCDNEQCIEY
jgi:hypothetical protein